MAYEVKQALIIGTWFLIAVLLLGGAIASCENPNEANWRREHELKKMKVCLDSGRDWIEGNCMAKN